MAAKPLVDHTFQNLRKLIRKKARLARRQHAPPAETTYRTNGNRTAEPSGGSVADRETALFEAAMAGVAPLNRGNCRDCTQPPSIAPAPQTTESDEKVLQQLERLVTTGAGFTVSLTPEYVQGTAEDIHPRVIDLMRTGRFSIQDTLNVRGMYLSDACQAFDRFIRTALRNSYRMVLVVHGRGLSSPAEPVLKTNLTHWLTSGRWRKQTLAFCSARSFDGGAGATYILLRRTS